MFRSLLAFRYKFAKAFCFIVFGLGSLLLAFLVFPFFHLTTPKGPERRRRLRLAVRQAFNLFVHMMRFMNVVRVTTIGRRRLTEAGNVVLVANHPSLLDVVVLISFMKKADCIVKAGLWSNAIVKRVVSSVYIPNDLDFEATRTRCQTSFEEGNALVIFPQGTRTSHLSQAKLQRGSAQLALRTGRDILPVKITLDDPAGLRKGDSLTHFPFRYCHHFQLEVRPPISVQPYLDWEAGKASRALTKLIAEAIV